MMPQDARILACNALCALQVVQFVLEAVRAEAFNPGTLFLFGCDPQGSAELRLSGSTSFAEPGLQKLHWQSCDHATAPHLFGLAPLWLNPTCTARRQCECLVAVACTSVAAGLPDFCVHDTGATRLARSACSWRSHARCSARQAALLCQSCASAFNPLLSKCRGAFGSSCLRLSKARAMEPRCMYVTEGKLACVRFRGSVT